MAFELVYTSAPKGIRPGSSGFGVVACTNGLGPRLIATLEGLSAYKPLYPHYADNAWDNPVSKSHYLFELNGERQHILKCASKSWGCDVMRVGLRLYRSDVR